MYKSDYMRQHLSATKRSDKASMITKLGLRNFKSISESGIEIDLKPLTVLIGPNASGKSSILEAIGIFAALRYFVWVVGNQGDPTGVSHGDEILYYFFIDN